MGPPKTCLIWKLSLPPSRILFVCLAALAAHTHTHVQPLPNVNLQLIMVLRFWLSLNGILCSRICVCRLICEIYAIARKFCKSYKNVGDGGGGVQCDTHIYMNKV